MAGGREGGRERKVRATGSPWVQQVGWVGALQRIDSGSETRAQRPPETQTLVTLTPASHVTKRKAGAGRSATGLRH